jgi:hypothetical protein
VGQDEGGAGYLGDPARAGGDVLQGRPAAGEQREAALAPAAQPAQQQVAGALAVIGLPGAVPLLALDFLTGVQTPMPAPW